MTRPNRGPPPPSRRKMVGLAAGVLLFLLGGLTVGQQRLWRNPVSFWEYNAAAIRSTAE
ncbi:MAG: hypothetical protein GWP05_04185 [Anaerolineaceae bacterium]|nr:hypothetical protein [Anaerolineaceae bacterium]